MTSTLTAEQHEILDLRDQVFDLQEQNAALIASAKAKLPSRDFVFTRAWCLTPAERQMLSVFASTEDWSASKQALHIAIRRNRATEIKIVDVMVCKLRKKLAPFGVDIETVWGFGYQIAPQSSAAFLIGIEHTAEPLLAKNSDTFASDAASVIASADNSKSVSVRA